MGNHTHNAIVVTSWHDDSLEKAHEEATRIFTALDHAQCVGGLMPVMVNGYRSFLIQPDGSKDWWEPSNRGDSARSAFTAWLTENQRTIWVDWVEVEYGDVDECCIVNDHVRRKVHEEDE